MDETGNLWAATPAAGRLRWLLDGLDGRWPADLDAEPVLAPEFTLRVPVERFVAVMRERAGALAPVRVVGLDVEGDAATARLRSADDELWVARVQVEPAAPYRIVSGYAQPSVPDYLAPRLPQDFGPGVEPGNLEDVPSLIIFSGVPGSGKSTVAEEVGRRLHTPVFALDWLLGSLSPFGLRHRSDLMELGEELLITLAHRELAAQRSVIIDTTTESPQVRRRWESLAGAFGARWLPVTCVCSDLALHRQRVERRTRSIPGWQDGGDWSDVEARLERFEAWPGSLRIDTTAALEECVGEITALTRA